MTVIQLFTVCPSIHPAGDEPFGVFTFHAASPVPVTYAGLLIKYATSICFINTTTAVNPVSIHKHFFP